MTRASPPRPVGPRGQSAWAPRFAVLSTLALLGAFVVSGPARSFFAFAWVSLALAAMALEWSSRRRGRSAAPVAARSRR